MEMHKAYLLLLVPTLFLVFFNSLLSREIFNWVPSKKRQVFLFLLVWFVPIAGFLLANKLGNLGWFRTRKTGRGTSAIAGGFMQADSVFNPGMKHTIEIVEKQKSEIRSEYRQADKEDKNSE